MWMLYGVIIETGDTEMFTIQSAAQYGFHVFAKTYDGRQVCVGRFQHRFEAALWIEGALKKLGVQ